MEESMEILIDRANNAIQQSIKSGMDGVSVNATQTSVYSTRFANSSIHQNFHDFESKFEITVVQGQKSILMQSNSLEREQISWVVDRACKMINSLPDDSNFPGILTTPQEYPKLQLNDPLVKDLSSTDVIDKILAGINAAHESSGKVKSVSGNINLRDGYSLYKSSENHEVITPTTSIISTVNVMADDGQGESRSNSSFGRRQFSSLPFEKEASQVAERAVMGLNPQDIEPKSYSVILDYQAAADQLLWVGMALSALAVLEHRSFLKDKIGEQIFSDALTIINDPHNPSLLGARALDSEGIATRKSILVREGILENLAFDRLSANRMGTESNGCGLISPAFGQRPFPFAMTAEPGKQGRQQLIEGVDNGLLVTNLHYSNFVDPSRGTVTGMTKDGLFLIKNGELIGSCRNLRFTDSLPEMFSTAELASEVSQVLSFWGLIIQQALAAPAMRIEAMKFTSKASH